MFKNNSIVQTIYAAVTSPLLIILFILIICSLFWFYSGGSSQTTFKVESKQHKFSGNKQNYQIRTTEGKTYSVVLSEYLKIEEGEVLTCQINGKQLQISLLPDMLQVVSKCQKENV